MHRRRPRLRPSSWRDGSIVDDETSPTRATKVAAVVAAVLATAAVSLAGLRSGHLLAPLPVVVALAVGALLAWVTWWLLRRRARAAGRGVEPRP